MGNVPNKEVVSKQDIRRRSFEKVKPEITIYNELQKIKVEIENYKGNGSDGQYRAFAKLLTNHSKALQDIRTATTNKDRHEEVNKALQIINNCFRILHTKKLNDKNLDQAAVESHSFINASNPSINLISSKGARRNVRGWKTLDAIQLNIRKLEGEVNTAIELEDLGKFKFLEEKVKLLLTDIEQIVPGADEALSRKKEDTTKKLLDNFKRLKGSQRKITRSSKMTTETDRGSRQVQRPKTEVEQEDFNYNILKDIESKLVDLEVTVLGFEDTNKDDSYKSIQQKFINYQERINNMTHVSKVIETKQGKALDLIDNLMSKLKKKSAKNEATLQTELQNIAEIEEEVISMESKIQEFRGTQESEDYKELDQYLRKLWDKLNTVTITLERVKTYKERVIKKIKTNIKSLHDKAAEKGQSKTEPIVQNILKQTTEFEIHWNILQYAIDSNEHPTNDLVLALTKLENINSNITAKCKELQVKLGKVENIKFEIKPGSYGTLNTNIKISDYAKPFDTKVQIDDYTKKSTVLEVSQPSTTIATSTITQTTTTEDKIKPLSTIDTYSKIQSIQRDITQINKTIDEFYGSKTDQKYQEIFMMLTEREEWLRTIDDLGKSSLEAAKTRANNKLVDAFAALKKKVSENETIAEVVKQRPQDEIADIVKLLSKLRKKVECFTGMYKDPQYLQIESGIQDCWGQLRAVDVGQNQKLQMAKNQTEEKICTYLQNLDEKSIKVEATQV